MIIWFFTIPAWFIFMIFVILAGLFDSIVGVINVLIWGILIVIALICIFWLIVLLVALFSGNASDDVGDLLFGGVCLFICAAYLAFFIWLVVGVTSDKREAEAAKTNVITYEEPYILHDDEDKENILSLPRVEQIKAVGCSGSNMSTNSHNTLETTFDGGYIIFYAGRKYEYLSLILEYDGSVDGFEIYADDVLVAEDMELYGEGNYGTHYYNINNCEYLKFVFKKKMEIKDIFLYKPEYNLKSELLY